MLGKLTACAFTLCCTLSYATADTMERQDSQDCQPHLGLNLLKTASISPTDSNEYSLPIFTAAADAKSSSAMQTETEVSAAQYEDRTFTKNKAHGYLGIGTIVAALLTLVTPKEEGGAHEYLAQTTTVLAIGAVATGFAFHHEDISMEGGLRDPDNLHALWAGLGAAGIAMSTAVGPDSPHGTYGALGTVGMLVGVKYTW